MHGATTDPVIALPRVEDPQPHALRDRRLTRFLERPRLGLWIVVLGVVLVLPSAFIGFQLDDLIGRFIFSDLPGAHRLFEIYAGGYGTANGNPADAAWMIEQGYAPWWMDRDLLLQLFRPLSLWTHLVDAALWPDSAFMWHVHSFVWFAFLLFAATIAFRSLQGPLIGGLAALLYSVDHTHSMAAGFITNRYVMIATAFSLLALREHHRYRQGAKRAGWIAVIWYGLALLAGESSASIVGYILGYALFMESGRWRGRALSILPYVVTTFAWRALYNGLGRGARGSDLYIDPLREPFQFAKAVIERAPILQLGQWDQPPAEYYQAAGPKLALGLIIAAWLFAIGLAFALWPLLKRDALARFWTTGMLLALVPICSAEPNNRMLFSATIGSCGLLARWWYICAHEQVKTLRSGLLKYSWWFGVIMLWGHLIISPIGVPVNASSLILLEPMKRSFDDVGAEAVGREAVFVTVPDYFTVRLMRMTKEVEHKPTPARWRALAFGPEQVTVTRAGERSLILEYAGGAMSKPALTKPAADLYRSRKNPMQIGQHVTLEGLEIELLAVTSDGRPLRARFDFAEPLDSARYRFYYWVDNHYRLLDLPAVGAGRALPPAYLEPELPGKDTHAPDAPPPSAAQLRDVTRHSG
jgi:hypothetical protein